MGFLLGASSGSDFIEIETTNQSIQKTAFKNSERSIDKTLQTYRFKAKNIFKYDLNWIEENEYIAICNLLEKYSMVAEGLFLVPIPFSEYPAESIIFAYTVHSGYYTSNPELEFPDSFYTELSSINQNKMKVYDNNSNVLFGKWSTFIFTFNVSDFIARFQRIDRLTLQINGMMTSPMNIFIWCYSQSKWINLKTFSHHKAEDLNSSKFYNNKLMFGQVSTMQGTNSVMDDFTDSSGYCKFRIMSNENPVNGNNIQFARLFINGYYVNSEDSNSLEDFTSYFTGAGRSGVLTFSEV